MATQKDLLKTAILTGAVEGMKVTGGFVDVSVPKTLTQAGAQVTAPVTGYCGLRTISTRGSIEGGYPWLSLESQGVSSNINCSWFSGGGTFSAIPVVKGAFVNIAGSEAEVDFLRFFKVIGGGGINDTFRRCLAIVSEVRYGFA